MLNVKQLTGEELYVLRDALLSKNYWNPQFIETYSTLKDSVEKEWNDRKLLSSFAGKR